MYPPEDIAKMNTASDIYYALTHDKREPIWDTQKGLIEMYDAAMYLYPEYADYYKDRIRVLKLEMI